MNKIALIIFRLLLYFVEYKLCIRISQHILDGFICAFECVNFFFNLAFVNYIFHFLCKETGIWLCETVGISFKSFAHCMASSTFFKTDLECLQYPWYPKPGQSHSNPRSSNVTE